MQEIELFGMVSLEAVEEHVSAAGFTCEAKVGGKQLPAALPTDFESDMDALGTDVDTDVVVVDDSVSLDIAGEAGVQAAASGQDVFVVEIALVIALVVVHEGKLGEGGLASGSGQLRHAELGRGRNTKGGEDVWERTQEGLGAPE
jgi:hypothetical protein